MNRNPLTATEARMSQLDEQLKNMERAAEQCNELTADLSVRLANVLSPVPAEPDRDARLTGIPPVTSFAPAAARVRNCAERIDSTITAMQDILNRLEA